MQEYEMEKRGRYAGGTRRTGNRNERENWTKIGREKVEREEEEEENGVRKRESMSD